MQSSKDEEEAIHCSSLLLTAPVDCFSLPWSCGPQYKRLERSTREARGGVRIGTPLLLPVFSLLVLVSLFDLEPLTHEKIRFQQFPDLARQATVEKWLAIHAAALNGHHRIVEKLFNHQYPPSMKNAYKDPSSKWEFTMPFDINAKDVADQSALYAACRYGTEN